MAKVVITQIKKKQMVVKGQSNQGIADLIIKHSGEGCSSYMVKRMEELDPHPEYTHGYEEGVWDNGKIVTV